MHEWNLIIALLIFWSSKNFSRSQVIFSFSIL